MSSRGIPDKTKLFELKRFTAGDLKRMLNETGFLKITSIISIGNKDRWSKYSHEVCIVTENGENININLSFDGSTDFRDGSAYRVAWIEIPRNNMKMQYIIEYNHTGNEEFEGFGGGLVLRLLGATFYEDENHIGTISLQNEYIAAWKNFSDKTMISLYAANSQFALSDRQEGLTGFESLRDNIDYQELVMYFSKLSAPINVQEIYEYITKKIKPEFYRLIEVIHSQSASALDLIDQRIDRLISNERASGAECVNRINYVFIEDGIIKANTTTEHGEAFTVLRDSDDWYYSNGSVVIRNLTTFYYSYPALPNLSISFRDAETAKREIGRIDFEHIFTRIAELQKELQEK